MTELKKCAYCGRLISEVSKEHIIQNAIGGLYESEDICCKECNNYVSKYIDAPFTKIFNPMVSGIRYFTKTHNKKSHPIYTGKAEYNHKIYDVSIKNGKVVSCPELSKELKCNISKLNLKILNYDFCIDNNAFKNGFSKIAFNFAIEKGIDVNLLKKGVNIQEKEGNIEKISFNYPVIPFVALNSIDNYIELDTEMELYHNLILFNQGNMLWCYIDLFNTFQYYVLLSQEFNDEISVDENYLQFLQKIDRTIPQLDIRTIDDICIYAEKFNVKPCMDLKIFEKRVRESIQKDSVKKSMSNIISSKLTDSYSDNIIANGNYLEGLNSLKLYFDENDRLREDTFRKVTFNSSMECVSYPLEIYNLKKNNELDVSSYTCNKFKRLNTFLFKDL